MIVYHGSNSKFKTLRIEKRLVKSNASLLNEGMGIYFSLDKGVAASYGKYLYTLNIVDKGLADFRTIKTCMTFLNQLARYVYLNTKNIDIRRYINLHDVAISMVEGQVAISGVAKEIELQLDSNELWHTLGETTIENTYRQAEKFIKQSLKAYLFNYNIKGIGILKRVDPDIVEIIACEKLE